MSKINFDVIPQCGAGMTDIEKMARLFSETFQGRIDAYGEGAGLCTKQNVTDEVIKAHLTGKKRIGRYPLAPNILGGSGTWWAAADVDEDQLTLAIEFGGYLWHIGIPCYIERSKSKGYHVWTFFSEPVPASTARAIMLNAVELLERDADYKVKEVFPKQTTIKNPDGTYGFGNYINLPLFGGDVPNGRTVFLNPDDGYNPYADQWAFLQTIRKLSSQELTEIVRDCLTEPTISPKTQTAIITPQVDSVARQTTRQNQKSGDDDFRGMLSKTTKDFIANGAPAGERNARLFKAVCDFAGCGELFDTAVAVLLPPALRSGLTQSEALATIRSAYGKPRTPSSPDALLPVVEFKNFHRTDLGNAEFTQALFGRDLRYDHTRKRWFIWTGHRWCLDRNNEAARLAERAIRRRLKLASDLYDLTADPDEKADCLVHIKWALQSENSTRINAAIELAQGLEGIATAGDEWDSERWLLGVKNGVVDLRTGVFREGRREDNITHSASISYDAKADAPRWNTFLLEVFDGKTELIQYIQRAVGYSLTGNISEHCLLLCYGTGRNGKSVFLNTITALLGDYASGTPFTTFEMSKFQSSNTNDLAALRGKRFVSARETQEARRLNEARIKAITGGDPITARFLYAEFFDYFPQFKVWLGVNHKPVIRDTSLGMWSRVRLIPFTVSFWGREDRNLEEKLKQELSGILSWAIEGCLAWQKLESLAEPKIVITATEEYREESDPVGVFLCECTEQKPHAITVAKPLYELYVQWAKDNGEEPVSQTTFGRRLAEKGYEKTRLHGGRTAYRGLDVRADEQK